MKTAQQQRDAARNRNRQDSMRDKPKVGDVLYLVDAGNNSGVKVNRECTVEKIGKIYFYAKLGDRTLAIRLDNWQEKGLGKMAYKSKKDYANSRKRLERSLKRKSGLTPKTVHIPDTWAARSELEMAVINIVRRHS